MERIFSGIFSLRKVPPIGAAAPWPGFKLSTGLGELFAEQPVRRTAIEIPSARVRFTPLTLIESELQMGDHDHGFAFGKLIQTGSNSCDLGKIEEFEGFIQYENLARMK